MLNVSPYSCAQACVTVTLGKSKTGEHLIHSVFTTPGSLFSNKLLCTEYAILPQFTLPPLFP